MRTFLKCFCFILIFSCSSGDDNNNNNPSCPFPVTVLFNGITTTAQKVSWSGPAAGNSYTLEYGLAGFSQGNGTLINTPNTNVILTDLETLMDYQMYIRSNCDMNESSIWVGPLNFFVNAGDCIASNLSVVTIDNTSVFLNWGELWNGDFSPSSWVIEYGSFGFELGTGTIINTNNNDLGRVIENLTPSTTYDFYVKGNCSNGGVGIFVGPETFTTPN